MKSISKIKYNACSWFCCLLIGFMLTGLHVAAQEEEYQNFGQAYGFSAGQQAWIFADTANVRSAADPGASIQDRLPQGDVVKIKAIGRIFELNQKKAPWCTISYLSLIHI